MSLTRIGSLWAPGEKANENVKAEGRIDTGCGLLLFPKARIKVIELREKEGQRDGAPTWGLFVVSDEK